MTSNAPTRSLQDLIDSVPSFVDHLYGNRKGSVLKDAVLRQPTQFVAPEFTSWRDEQLAWRNGVAFYDQSFHMNTTYLRGKDAVRVVSDLAVNSFATFGVDRSRHLVLASPDGYLLGDGILYCLAPDEVALVGRASGHNYVRYNATHGGYDVSIEEDEFFSDNPNGRRTMYRYQVEGPKRRPSSRSSPVRRCPRRRSSTSCTSPSPASRCRPCSTRWPATPAPSSSARGTTAPP